MKYIEWNNIISNYFFNDSNAGKEVHLYLTKADLLKLGKKYFHEVTEDDVWKDFLKSIRNGLPGSNGNIIARASDAYQRKSLLRIENVEVQFPPYIIYLVFLVLPLTEQVEGDFNTNNYFDRLNLFLKNHQIDQKIKSGDFRDNNINSLWESLSEWAIIKKQKDYGSFSVKPFSHNNWVYVGKIFSQCIFPPSSMKKLPELFLEAGMVPDSNYEFQEFKQCLLRYGSTILSLPDYVLELIKKNGNELGESIIDITRKEYTNWTGESHIEDDSGLTISRNDITSRIYLQFKISFTGGRIEFSYRIKSVNEIPEDLILNGIKIIEEKKGYSKTINLPYKDSFHLKDNFYQWVAKFPYKSIRLFINAAALQLSSDYWIETDILVKSNWMYLLCHNSKRKIIYEWLKNDCSKFIEESEDLILPNDYSLFKFLNPQRSLEGVPELTIIRDKTIKLISALQYDFRTFTNDFLPEVELINSNGSERIYLQYKNKEERHFIEKDEIKNTWPLRDVATSIDFNVRVESETLIGNETTYRIISSDYSSLLLSDKKLPKRDSFGNITNENATVYCCGSNTVGIESWRLAGYKHLFRGLKEDLTNPQTELSYNNVNGNLLLSYLTLKGTTTAEDFFTAFDIVFSKSGINNNQDENFNYPTIRKASLNYFDYLGYLDYNYEGKSIVINPPQMIFIPASKGRKALLIGGRDKKLVDSMIDQARKYNLQIVITKQFNVNTNLLLPDAITIQSFGTSIDAFGENNLADFANAVNIRFDPDKLVQVELHKFCSDLTNYEQDLISNKRSVNTYEGWPRYLFNSENLKFEKSDSENFDKTLSLLEYRIRPWEYYHRIWINNECFSVDRNWGKYLILNKLKLNVILKGDQKVAIPTETPLPRLLFESVMLCSGIAPQLRLIDRRTYRIFENIPSMVTVNLFNKLGQEPINDKIS